LTCGNEVCESLALATIGNIGSLELANELAGVVVHKAFDERRGTPVYVRKRACLTLLSFFKRNKAIFSEEVWVQGFKDLLSNTNYGLLMSACSLIQGTVLVMGRPGFDAVVHPLIKILSNINSHATDYYYYQTACPWLQIKALKILQLFPAPEDKSADLTMINEYLLGIVNKTEVTKNVNKNNSDHSILFEAINLIIHYKNAAYEVLRKDIVTLLGKFISVKEPNIRYLALETMSKLQGI
jgi:AP-2 complex subunit alpha